MESISSSVDEGWLTHFFLMSRYCAPHNGNSDRRPLARSVRCFTVSHRPSDSTDVCRAPSRGLFCDAHFLIVMAISCMCHRHQVPPARLIPLRVWRTAGGNRPGATVVWQAYFWEGAQQPCRAVVLVCMVFVCSSRVLCNVSPSNTPSLNPDFSCHRNLRGGGRGGRTAPAIVPLS